MTRQRVLTELSVHEKSHALVMLGRGTVETFKGLDIIPPRFATIVEYDNVPLIAANIPDRIEMMNYVSMIQQSLARGDKVAPVCVPTRMSVKQSFLMTLRKARGTEPIKTDELAGVIRVYLTGYLDGMVQWAGFKAAQEVARQYRYMGKEDWEPDESWYYWNQPLQEMGFLA